MMNPLARKFNTREAEQHIVHLRDKAMSYDIPYYTMESLIIYAMHSVATGGFLEAVLSNDLFKAVSRADDENQERLADIVKFIYNHLPNGCYGSYEHYRTWLDYRYKIAVVDEDRFDGGGGEDSIDEGKKDRATEDRADDRATEDRTTERKI
jgi:hypothetical protein